MLLSLVIRDCSQFIQHLSKFFFHIFIIFVGQALKLEEEDGRSSGSGSVISVICKWQVWWWWAKVAIGMKTWRTDIRCWILIDLIERIEGEGESKLIWLLFCILVLLDLDFEVKKIVETSEKKNQNRKKMAAPEKCPVAPLALSPPAWDHTSSDKSKGTSRGEEWKYKICSYQTIIISIMQTVEGHCEP